MIGFVFLVILFLFIFGFVVYFVGLNGWFCMLIGNWWNGSLRLFGGGSMYDVRGIRDGGMRYLYCLLM